MRIIAQVVIGYMYKVMKNEKDISKFNNEFAAIRHGDYIEFLDLIGDEIDFIVTYNNGLINIETNIREDDSDYGRLLKSGESLKTFLLKCTKEFGKIADEHLNDETFEKLALFELSLRMHRNNNASRKERITLENVIIDLKEIKRLSDQESDALQNGRKFLNCVKRPNKIKTTWKEGEREFLEAYKILESRKLTII
jgi:hypothetical protein